MKFFTRFNPPPSPGVLAQGGLTDQHQKDDCDLNIILKRYRVGGLPPPPPARYEDLTRAPKDLQEAFERVQESVDWFDSLSSETREKFGNDPRKALELLSRDIGAAFEAGLLPSDEYKQLKEKAAEAAKPEPEQPAAEPAEAEA